jgi:hypothetical protein
LLLLFFFTSGRLIPMSVFYRCFFLNLTCFSTFGPPIILLFISQDPALLCLSQTQLKLPGTKDFTI